MPSIDEKLSAQLEVKTNNCRMELVSLQAEYYMLIIKSLYMKYLKQYESIEVYTNDELLEMLQTVEDTVNALETESMIDGTQKYDMRESMPFIEECMYRVMQSYGFSGWIIK